MIISCLSKNFLRLKLVNPKRCKIFDSILPITTSFFSLVFWYIYIYVYICFEEKNHPDFFFGGGWIFSPHKKKTPIVSTILRFTNGKNTPCVGFDGFHFCFSWPPWPWKMPWPRPRLPPGGWGTTFGGGERWLVGGYTGYPWDPKTMTNKGFTSPIYGLSPLKMKVVGSHGSGWNILKQLHTPSLRTRSNLIFLCLFQVIFFTDSIMVNHDFSSIIWGICLWRGFKPPNKQIWALVASFFHLVGWHLHLKECSYSTNSRFARKHVPRKSYLGDLRSPW